MRIYLTVLLLLLSSCAIRNLDEYLKSPASQQNGMVLVRGITFHKVEDFNKYLKDPLSYRGLNSWNTFDFTVSKVKGGAISNHFHLFDMEWLQGEKLGEARYVYKPYTEPTTASEFFTLAHYPNEILKPTYFYSLCYLKPGKYYISQIRIQLPEIGTHVTKFYSDEETHYEFNITAGVVNYIGDIYYVFAKTSESYFFPMFDYGVGGILVQNRGNEARKFINEFYPQLNTMHMEVNLAHKIVAQD